METADKLLQKLSAELSTAELSVLLRLFWLCSVGLLNEFQALELFASVVRNKPKFMQGVLRCLFKNGADLKKIPTDPTEFATFVHSAGKADGFSLSPSYKVVPERLRLPVCSRRSLFEEQLYNDTVVAVAIGREFKTGPTDNTLDLLLDTYTDQLAEIDTWLLRFKTLFAKKTEKKNREKLSGVEKEVVYRLYKEHTKSILDASENIRKETLIVLLDRIETKAHGLEEYRLEVVQQFKESLERIN